MLLSQALISSSEAGLIVRDTTISDTPLANMLIVQGSEEIEKVLDRNIVSRGTITEYHSFLRPSSRLWLREWPILGTPTVVIHEDETREYLASTLLVEGDDYEINSEEGYIVRIDGDCAISWLTGFEAVQVVYAAGYSQANVPGDLKKIALELFSVQWNETVSRSVGVQTITDGLGARTYFGPAELTSHQRQRLARRKRISFGGSTYSRSSVA